MTIRPPHIAIAIPARNEADQIGRCLDAIAAQVSAGPMTVVVLANNCNDTTVEIARRPRGLNIHVIEHAFPPEQSRAGHARRMAMAEAATRGEIILTTDADCIPDPDWVQSHRKAFGNGVDAVAGRVSADWNELQHHPAEALRIGALEWEYLGLIGEAEAVFDPLPHDRAPRHAQRCGANLGITRQMLEFVGGVPAVAVGEDRALLAAVERLDGRVRHAVGPHVTASARINGRAAGGMADALSARGTDQYRCDEQFERFEVLVNRWQARKAARAAWVAGEPHFTFGETMVPLDHSQEYFGTAWAGLQETMFAASPLCPDALPAEIASLRACVARHA